MRKRSTWRATGVVLLSAGGMLIVLLKAPTTTPAMAGTKPVSSGVTATLSARQVPPPVTFQPVPAAVSREASPQAAKPGVGLAGSPGVLDQRRQYALGMIETGNHDGRIGGLGEVSRYQIMPSVWRRYSDSESYRNPEVSLAVAQHHWTALYTGFKSKAHREPTDFDMYVLWNTHYGYYASRNYNPALIGPVVRDRAQRYVNLVECGWNG